MLLKTSSFLGNDHDAIVSRAKAIGKYYQRNGYNHIILNTLQPPLKSGTLRQLPDFNACNDWGFSDRQADEAQTAQRGVHLLTFASLKSINR